MDIEPSWKQRYREYLLLAQESRRAAFGSDDAKTRRSFERIADRWQQLAEHVAKTFLRRKNSK
jgi:hypothetical protein